MGISLILITKKILLKLKFEKNWVKSMSDYIIRQIKSEDNPEVKKIVQEVLVEFGVPKIGTAYEDKSLENMYTEYDKPGHIYFVLEEDGKIIGGAGIAPLAKGNEEICELQKMYFLPVARNRGIGSQMMEKCLSEAKEMGYTQCYLETMPYMHSARKLYSRSGFTNLEKPMGDTGHYNCQTWMIKKLKS